MASRLPHPGPSLRAARERRGLTLEEVAEGTGLSTATISRVEGEKHRGKPSTIEALAAFYGVDPSALLQGIWEGEDQSAAPEVASAGGRAGLERSFSLESGVEADGHATGPAAMRHPRLADRLRVYEQGHSRRGAPAPNRSVSLAGVPIGCEVFEVRADRPVLLYEDAQVVDALRPGELLIVDPKAPLENGDLALVLVDDEDGASTLLVRHRLFAGVPLLIRMDGVGMPMGRDVEVMGVVVERRLVS